MDVIHHHYKPANVMTGYNLTTHHRYPPTDFLLLWFLKTVEIWFPLRSDFVPYLLEQYFAHSSFVDVHFYRTSKKQASNTPVDKHVNSMCLIYYRMKAPSAYPVKIHSDQALVHQMKINYSHLPQFFLSGFQVQEQVPERLGVH